MRRINDAGTTVFLTTQYLEEADQLCDRLAIIDKGRIVAAGTPAELKSAMGHDVVRIDVADADVAAARDAVAKLAGLQQVVEEGSALALYVDNGAAAIPDLVRLLDKAKVVVERDLGVAAQPGRRVPQGDRPPPRRRRRDRRGGRGMRSLRLLTRRAVQNTLRNPEATFPLLFIPVFFLLVNVGQLGEEFDGAPFLHGQGYVGFQLPVSLLFAVIGISSGLAIVFEIENGYFDKLLVAPIPRLAILGGWLGADFLRNLVTATAVLVIGIAFGVRMESGSSEDSCSSCSARLRRRVRRERGAHRAAQPQRADRQRDVVPVLPAALPSPTTVPRENMQGWMEVASKVNPVTYVIEGVPRSSSKAGSPPRSRRVSP